MSEVGRTGSAGRLRRAASQPPNHVVVLRSERVNGVNSALDHTRSLVNGHQGLNWKENQGNVTDNYVLQSTRGQGERDLNINESIV